ncbi:MAG: response regulator [Cyanobacteria bacterium P01_F01_bin.53]
MSNQATATMPASPPNHWGALSEKGTILVVDDNLNNLQVMCDFLGEHGYQIAIAQNGEQTLETANLSRPDVILLDVMMPGIDGFETCQRLKANPETRDIPVLFMTALSDTVSQVKGLTIGAVDYITKPVKHEEALARLKVHLALRNAQVELIQKEKMAALGQMVAGIAHEINNPVNFIHGNLTPATEYADALLSLIKLYETHTTAPPEVQDFAKQIDLPFIKEDFLPMLSSMHMGTQRIHKIVQSLRTFSRLDESEQKSADLNEGLESTLLLLQSRLEPKENNKEDRPAIKIVKNYGTLPPINCYPGKLNQVFMNLLTNSIDALDEKFIPLSAQEKSLEEKSPEEKPLEEPTITISTANNDKQTIIRITDNGAGVPPSIQRRIFDQFFTTKPVGKGTGLGLTISNTIINKDHQGLLTFCSQVNKGTEFTITFPAVAPIP